MDKKKKPKPKFKDGKKVPPENKNLTVKKKGYVTKVTRDITTIEKQIHKGWITKIKFYPDLNYIISSSLDGFIHIHHIESL